MAAAGQDNTVGIILSPNRDWTVLRSAMDARIKELETLRWSWWTHWRELGEYILPRRLRWLVTPNQWNRGSPVNQRIIDPTGTLAARTLASGMMSGITNPGRPWFRLQTTSDAINDMSEVKIWCADTVQRMQRVMSSSNYYTSKAVQYFDLAVFGTAPLLVYEHPTKTIQAFNPRPGEYYCSAAADGTVNVLYRKFTLSVGATVAEFGIDNVSGTTKQAFANRGASMDRDVVIAHGIEPNPDFIDGGGELGASGVPRHFQYREVYWEWGVDDRSRVLKVSGYQEWPMSVPRWDVEGNDAYGRSPAMDALGDIKQLQMETKRKAQAIDKMVNPPMIADISMKNEPASLLPGAVNYVPSLSNGVGFRPAFTIMPPIQEIIEDLKDIQGRIKDTFFNDLFLMISQLDTVRTATEIDARREEKLVQLGPVLERFNTEGLDPDINRIFRIMWRKGMFMPMPAPMHGQQLKVAYISVLADQQRASASTAIERLFQFVGNIAGAVPEALDKLDVDEAIDEYADILLVPPKVVRADKALAVKRQQRAQAQQQQQAAQTSMAAVQGAQTLSNTDVGGGQNALQMMLSGLPQGGGQGQQGAP